MVSQPVGLRTLNQCALPRQAAPGDLPASNTHRLPWLRHSRFAAVVSLPGRRPAPVMVNHPTWM